MHQLKQQIQQKLSSEKSPIEVVFEKPLYEDIELDFEESEEALRIAREAKYFRQQRQAYFDRISKPETYLKHTAEELFTMFSSGFKLANKEHEDLIKHLCCYFAKEPRGKFDQGKGILLMGSIGNGKTSVMRFFRVNQLQSYKIESMLDITSDYKTQGETGLKCYDKNFQADKNVYGLTDYGFCLDDVGTEENPARHYAESKSVFAEIIQTRYNYKDVIPFNSTHATTNKNEEDLLNMYGSRCYDRMKEMFNIVVFRHNSWR